MKNITVSVDEETYRLARITAAERGTSVSALVREYLNGLVGGPLQGSERTLSEVAADFRARGVRLSVSDNVSREELYERDALR